MLLRVSELLGAKIESVKGFDPEHSGPWSEGFEEITLRLADGSIAILYENENGCCGCSLNGLLAERLGI